ncbi:hypothetical protein L1283_004139 [Sphingobacterium sp. HSC-15S19]
MKSSKLAAEDLSELAGNVDLESKGVAFTLGMSL